MEEIEALLPAGSYFWLGDDLENGAVTAWNDRLQGLTLAPGTSPTAQDNGTTGRREVLFVGANSEFLDTAGGALTIAQPYSSFLVYQKVTNSGLDSFWSRVAVGNVYFICNGTLLRIRSTTVLETAATLNTALATAASLANGASSQIWKNNVSLVTGNAGTTGFSSDNLRVGALGNGGTPSSFLDGTIATLIIYNGDITGNLTALQTKFDEYYGGALP